jgi:hypothetical protein
VRYDTDRMFTRAWLFALAALLVSYAAAFAHHGTNASYDLTKRMTFKGTVTEFAWSNPHVQIYFDAADDSGKVVNWAAETGSPGVLAREGWTKHLLKPGDPVTVILAPAKTGATVGVLVKLTLADGKEFDRAIPGN